MRFANLIPPAAIVAGAACLLAAAHGAVPVPPIRWPEAAQTRTAPPVCERLPYVRDPAAPGPADPGGRPVCALSLDRIAPAEAVAAP